MLEVWPQSGYQSKMWPENKDNIDLRLCDTVLSSTRRKEVVNSSDKKQRETAKDRNKVKQRKRNKEEPENSISHYKKVIRQWKADLHAHMHTHRAEQRQRAVGEPQCTWQRHKTLSWTPRAVTESSSPTSQVKPTESLGEHTHWGVPALRVITRDMAFIMKCQGRASWH